MATFKITTITPELAAAWLANGGINRKINQARVNEYAETIRTGKWRLTNQGIALTKNCQVVDGQHRLQAVVEAGCSATMLVMFDADPDQVREAVDNGVTRMASHFIQLSRPSETNTNAKAAVVRALFIITTPGYYVTGHIPNYAVLPILDLYHAELEYVISSLPSTAVRAPAMAKAICVLLCHKDSELGREFVDALASGAGLAAFDPRLMLRNWLQNRSSSAQEVVLAKTIICADAFVHGEVQLAKLAATAERRYPRLCSWLGIDVQPTIAAQIGRS